MTTEPLAVSVARSRDGGVLVSVRYSYEGRPAAHRRRVEMAKALLREALDRLDDGEVADIGFAEDSAKRFRTDRMEA